MRPRGARARVGHATSMGMPYQRADAGPHAGGLPFPRPRARRSSSTARRGVMPSGGGARQGVSGALSSRRAGDGRGAGNQGPRCRPWKRARIHIALASHGLVVEELTRRGTGRARNRQGGCRLRRKRERARDERQLTPDICDVYAGRITNWKELGGPDIAIAPRTRPDSEVDAEVVRGKIACLKDLKMPGRREGDAKIRGHRERARRHGGRCRNDDNHRSWSRAGGRSGPCPSTASPPARRTWGARPTP